MLLSIQPLWLDISDRVKSFTKRFETKQKLDKGGQWGGAGEKGVGKAFSISNKSINNLSEKHDQLK